ncbi:hypothetical protein OIPHN330_58580 (plasmid) [Citrobacter freundii]|nr:hypothetical protein TMSI_53670 [Klebsiella quasipneumoniae]BBM27958.1 hypothetical protein OIPHN069_44730 [Enterobacter hormaechei subsp. hoffmannii]BEJ37238.1 hypothetical protein OIPHN330_58580 [Citrobacter freundii]BEJ43198.1 hypothetical protein OIPHN354_59100 [Citrobacter freundii]
MEINNWVDFALYTAYFIGVIVVLIPLGINFTCVGIAGVIKHKKIKYDRNTASVNQIITIKTNNLIIKCLKHYLK